MDAPRRTFLSRIASASAALAAAGLLPRTVRATEGTHPPHRSSDDWLARYTGPHRQIFDVSKHLNGSALGVVNNYLTALYDVHGARPGEVHAAIGLHGGAIPMAFGDALWAKYRVGETLGVDDPRTRARALRNPWHREQDPESPAAKFRIAALQERGLVVLVCGNVVRAWARRLAASGDATPEAVYDELVAGLIPDAIVVPAMVVAFQQAQAAGWAYVYASA